MLCFTLFKSRKKISYDIYDYAINGIYKKLFIMYILVFQWGQCRREIIFRRWEQKPLQVTVGEKTVHNDIMMGAS